MKDNSNKSTLEKIEFILLSVTAGVCFIIAVLDLSGLLDNIAWITKRISSLILLSVASVAGYLIVERRRKLDELAISLEKHTEEILETVNSSTSETIKALKGVELKSFQHNADFYEWLIKRLRTAKNIDDITWETEVIATSGKELKALEQYRKMVLEIAKKPNVIWREIVIFTSRPKFERFKQRLSQDIPGYNLVYYERLPQNSPRKITFVIVDNEEIFLLGDKISLAIKHPDIIKYFSEYYERLWSQGKVLKANNRTNQEELKHLEATLQ